MKRLLIIGLFACALGVGILAGKSSTAGAACGVPLTACALQNQWHVSTAQVYHYDQVDTHIIPVEPDDIDSWEITSVHSTASGVSPVGCRCVDYSASVTADVQWTGNGWSVSCTGCDGNYGPIYDVSLCEEAGCGGSSVPPEYHGWAYKLLVKVADTRANMCSGNAAYLTSVSYETTAVDDGDRLDVSPGNCQEVAAVTPTSQSWGDTDAGPFNSYRCPFSCTDNNDGPQISIIYD